MLVAVTLLPFLVITVGAQQQPTTATEAFDFIVVGGGTAGCAVASRLSENDRYSVLLLHSGGLPPPQLDIPALTAPFYADPNAVETFATVPQENAAGSNNGVVNFLVGRPIGGTSAMNAMFVNRGSPLDYNQWAQITGDESWNYDNMLKYFKRFEDYRGHFAPEPHGQGGPIGVGRPYFEPGLSQWLQAGRELGFPIADPNGPQRNSFHPIEHNRRDGRRVSSFHGYIQPFLNTRRNLRVLLDSPVERVVIENNRAVGVVFMENASLPIARRPVFVRARNEVILSAGVMGSPVVLFRSGIGPRQVLQEIGVTQVRNLPVGENLQDHPLLTMEVSFNQSDMVLDPARDLTQENWNYFLRFGDGPYSCFQGATGQAFFASSVASRERQPFWPDSEIQVINTGAMHLGGGGAQPPMPPGRFRAFSVAMVGRPKSRGRLAMNLTDGRALVDFRYFSHPDDLQIMQEALRTYLRAIESTTAYQRAGATFTRPNLPACDRLEYRSDEYWRCYIRQTTQSGWHGAGTCSMGRGAEDPNAVVDSRGRVLGIRGLRVVDASIMPRVTNANTMAAVYAIAEKLSEVIGQEWARQVGSTGSASTNTGSQSRPGNTPTRRFYGQGGRNGR